jgi:F-type H+-transporting ATPase subunit b
MKKKIIFFILYLFLTQEVMAKEGMPQLNPEFWLSQIFWLIIFFGVLYFLIHKFFSPKLFSLIDQRADLLRSLISETENNKNQIQKLDNEYNKIIDEAKKNSKEISAKLNDEFNEKISIKKKEFENYLNAETTKVENDINHFKQQALDNISEIASEFSKELIEKITGTKPNDSNLKVVISEISKKHKESRHV